MISRSLVILLVATSALTACQKEEAKPLPPRPVLSVIANSTAASSLSLPGTVQPKIETQLGFRVLGRIIARNVSVGDLVKKGDIVAAIDPLSLELAVRSSQSDLANSQAQLSNATSSEERQRNLLAAHSGSEASVEEAEQARKSAAAAVGKAQANLNKAQEQLGYAKLLAEFDGVVTATAAEVGQVVSAGANVVTIARPDQRDAVIDIPEASFDGLKEGSPFEVALQLDPSITTKGVVREIAPEADAMTRTRRTKISLVDPPAAFRLGSVVTATASAPVRESVTLPSSSVLQKDGKDFVWRVDTANAKIALQEVKLEGHLIEGGTAKIASGVRDGDRIAVAGVHKFTDGQSIKIDEGATQ